MSMGLIPPRMLTGNDEVHLPTAEQIHWAYQACTSSDFASFTVDEKTAVMDMFINVLRVLKVRFKNDTSTIVEEAGRRREGILTEIEDAKLEYATLKTMLAVGHKPEENCLPSQNQTEALSLTLNPSKNTAVTRKCQTVKEGRVLKKKKPMKTLSGRCVNAK